LVAKHNFPTTIFFYPRLHDSSFFVGSTPSFYQFLLFSLPHSVPIVLSLLGSYCDYERESFVSRSQAKRDYNDGSRLIKV
jgi:hypothetical protein